MFIRSERLFLRPAWPEDRVEIDALLSAGAVMSNVSGEGLVAAHRDGAGRAGDPLLPRFTMTLPDCAGGRLIGAIGLGRSGGGACPDRDGAEPSLGYWIAARDWGQGYAVEATRAVLRAAGALGHRRILARHRSGNDGAERVLTKAGFARTTVSSDAGGTSDEATYAASIA